MLTVDFAGEIHYPDQASAFVVGRDGDLAIDDNPYLHRRFLELRWETGLWWLCNVGSQLSATAADRDGGIHALVSPGGRLPVVFEQMSVRFTAGSTSYEFELSLDDAPYVVQERPERSGSSMTQTIGRVNLTRDQKLLIVALAEPALRQRRGMSFEIPSSAEAAARLGWTLTKFNRKLDNVCHKLTTKLQVKGLHGESGNLASGRRARLVEHALATHLVTAVDLMMLDESQGSDED